MAENIIPFTAMLLRLKQAWQTLAMPADVQLSLLPDFVCKADELILTFDHSHSCARSNEQGALSEPQKASLAAVDNYLSATMDGQRHLWTEDAVKNSTEWETLRDLNKAALASFGWEVAVPPSYAFEYVPGKR